MPHYEIIFEDGSYSVANYEDDDEAGRALKAHHERAVNGESALSSDPDSRVKATRIAKVFKYDTPPGDMFESQALPTDQLESELKNLIASASKDGVTDLAMLAAEIRNLSNPLVASGAHESNYKAEATEELDASLWESTTS